MRPRFPVLRLPVATCEISSSLVFTTHGDCLRSMAAAAAAALLHPCSILASGQGLEQGRTGLERLEQVHREGELRGVAAPPPLRPAASRGGGRPALRPRVPTPRGGGGHDIAVGDGDQFLGETREVIVDQLQLQRVVRSRRHQCRNLERRASSCISDGHCSPMPMSKSIEHVDAPGAAELVEHRVDAGEVRELEHGGHLGEALYAPTTSYGVDTTGAGHVIRHESARHRRRTGAARRRRPRVAGSGAAGDGGVGSWRSG
ncbi:hypothetical protein HU200_054843 [Digitaria exilis]|uniref:Uncharacterized protein n=1 Tax=Digitaria exilis TaxID=1010633 RepID=A0A835APA1_9POAL|nr:hypothetical protein HU200_054843 [Digitaria exilis]